MHIRKLLPDDVQQYRAVRLRALRDEPSAFGSSLDEEADRPLQFFAAQLAPGSERELIGAFEGDTLVGIVGITREEGAKEMHRAFLRSMFVAPQSRGQGIGKQLLANALCAVDAMPGVRQVTLAVTAGNTAALALYEAAGFRPYGRAPEALFVQGAYHDEILMVLRTSAG